MASVFSRRYLSIWLRRFATDRVTRQRARPADRGSDPGPLVLTGAVKNARLVVALNDAAARAGLRVGQSFADACAILPALIWAEAAPVDDARVLAALCAWCERYTPLAALQNPDGLILDIAGVAHLFGGEDALGRDAVERLAAMGFSARAGVADTVGAAWAAARYGKLRIIPTGQTREALAPLPLAALRLPPQMRDGLVQLGLVSVGDIMARPRAPLTARFGAELLRRLDQAMGHEEEPITPRTPLPPLSIEQGFSEPLLREEDLHTALARLGEQLCRILEQRGQGARQWLASFFAVDGIVRRIELGTSRALHDPLLLNRLFTDKFSVVQWDNEFGFDRIRFSVLEAETFLPLQKDLTETQTGSGLAHLIDRLSARLGERRVLRPILQDSHVPEHASAFIPAAYAREFAPPPGTHAAAQGEHDSLAPFRPVRLFERPEPVAAIAEIPDGPPVKFRWRRVLHEVCRVEGPERIAMPWWRDDESRAVKTRDYFRVETADGARLWLYREGGSAESAPPNWFLHGFLP